MSESKLEIAERHVVEGEMRIARQRELVAKMERGGHELTAAEARIAVSVMETTLELMRDHLRKERGKQGSWTGG